MDQNRKTRLDPRPSAKLPDRDREDHAGTRRQQPHLERGKRTDRRKGVIAPHEGTSTLTKEHEPQRDEQARGVDHAQRRGRPGLRPRQRQAKKVKREQADNQQLPREVQLEEQQFIGQVFPSLQRKSCLMKHKR